MVVQSLDWHTYEIIQPQPLLALSNRTNATRTPPPLTEDDPWFVASKQVSYVLVMHNKQSCPVLSVSMLCFSERRPPAILAIRVFARTE